jgi:hypothetical protein
MSSGKRIIWRGSTLGDKTVATSDAATAKCKRSGEEFTFPVNLPYHLRKIRRHPTEALEGEVSFMDSLSNKPGTYRSRPSRRATRKTRSFSPQMTRVGTFILWHEGFNPLSNNGGVDSSLGHCQSSWSYQGLKWSSCRPR